MQAEHWPWHLFIAALIAIYAILMYYVGIIEQLVVLGLRTAAVEYAMVLLHLHKR